MTALYTFVIVCIKCITLVDCKGIVFVGTLPQPPCSPAPHAPVAPFAALVLPFSFLSFTAHPVKRTREEALQTRHALLDAATVVFHQRGVARASLEEIARTAGLSRGAVYWHFRNKEDLFEALCQRHFAVMQEDMSRAMDHGNPQAWPEFLQLCINFQLRLAQDPDARRFYTVLHLQCEETPDNAAITRILRHHKSLWHQQLLSALAIGQRHHYLPAELDIDAACTLFMCTLFGIANQWLADPGSFDMAECAPRYVHSCIHMLSHSPWLMRAPLPAPLPESAPPPATAP